MQVHEIKQGLDLPLSGGPVNAIHGEILPTRVAVVADDFPGMKPGMKVKEGDIVLRGQVLFEDRKSEGVLHTAPAAGRVAHINRGARRALQSIVIEVSDAEKAGRVDPAEQVQFAAYTGKPAADLNRQQIVDLLVESGQWAALRARPYGKVPSPSTTPHSLFVTAIDTNPHAPVPDVVINRRRRGAMSTRREDFVRGLDIVARLTEGKTYLCVHADEDAATDAPASVQVERFRGPHPAGNPGLHIHRLDPVSRAKTVWQIGYQDVIAIGHLFATGELDVERVVSIAGPMVADPRLVRTRLGASIADLAGDEGGGEEVRLVAGSALSGKTANGEIFGFLGRYHLQVSVLREGRERVFMGWLTPGLGAFSNMPIYLSRLFGRNKKYPLSTSTNGSQRAMVPIGAFERVMPMDIEPTFLLRALIVGDVEQAEKLGALELEEEDLALCSFVCPGKADYGLLLRKNLEIIEKEG
jgi:Na+-transporting NADH:ubiquinone oxidoreductase subunit A